MFEQLTLYANRKPMVCIGDKFGRLTVIDMTRDSKSRIACRCSCGKVHHVKPFFLLDGTTKSCGCFRKDRAATLQPHARA